MMDKKLGRHSLWVGLPNFLDCPRFSFASLALRPVSQGGMKNFEIRPGNLARMPVRFSKKIAQQ